jgi:hypothetical protein
MMRSGGATTVAPRSRPKPWRAGSAARQGSHRGAAIPFLVASPITRGSGRVCGGPAPLRPRRCLTGMCAALVGECPQARPSAIIQAVRRHHRRLNPAGGNLAGNRSGNDGLAAAAQKRYNCTGDQYQRGSHIHGGPHNPKVAGSNPAPAIPADRKGRTPKGAAPEGRPRPRGPLARAAFVDDGHAIPGHAMRASAAHPVRRLLIAVSARGARWTRALVSGGEVDETLRLLGDVRGRNPAR